MAQDPYTPKPGRTPVHPSEGGNLKRSGKREAPLPHDRDESSQATDGAPDERMNQAHRDLQEGRQDTDRGPIADQTYQKQKR